ncbi:MULTISPECIES: metalloregulator ArsR/SmtB family transcription factor [Clostridium]|uniref:Winged helix-turn-helix transcriptional regulator n=1 Tax=Clostridium senegalense TaxID=1465809 RepID=A0A6M0H6S6_9CLOT|nr:MULTISPECIES: metalloregulator ArsR/SmtB family transcription factor [Clostridium]NEU06227.1 winged helix-turn-helix transcriptional regulator [Clostridium senegalense]
MEKNLEFCKCTQVHKDIVKDVKENIPSEEILNSLSELFKAFGDMTRIKIIYVLFQKEMCVCDIAETLQMSQSAISHQLRVLKSARLVKFRKDGKVVYYSLDDDHVKYIFDKALLHVKE